MTTAANVIAFPVTTGATIMRRCPHCRLSKPLGEWTRNQRNKSGIGDLCLTCNAARVQAYQTQPDQIEKRRAAWKNDPQKKVRFDAWRKASPRHSFSVTIAKRVKDRPTERPITVDELMDLWRRQGGRCALSGILMTWADGHRPTSISIDRINGQRGYSSDNVRLVCWAINAFRHTMSDDEMYAMAVAIVEHRRRLMGAVA